MSIWGSLIGGMIGFSLGGPFGMLLGSLLGGKISRAKSSARFGSFAQPQQIFALALIVLSAKLRKADGQVSKEELVAVKDKLKIPENELDQVGKIFNKAKEESTGYEPYAKQIAQIYSGNINVLEEVINTLFYIAEADGNVSNSELKMIEHIAQIFGLTEIQFNSIKDYKKYLTNVETLKESEEISKTEIGDLKKLADEEIKEIKDEILQLEKNLEISLLPEDPNDNSNVFLEIRAGTGGLEAAIFAGDLYKMYCRFAERQSWEVELLSENFKVVLISIILSFSAFDVISIFR